MKIDLETDLKSARVVFSPIGRGSVVSSLVINPRESEQFDVHNVPLTQVIDDSGSDGFFFAFWEEDCAFPPIYIVRADSFESAYEVFVEEFCTPLDDVTLQDYEGSEDAGYDDLTWTERGWVSTESVMGQALTVREVSFSEGGES